MSAPTEVTAIGGSRSATVVWCPPASGVVIAYQIENEYTGSTAG